MPTFNLTMPTGESYQVDAPDENAAAMAVQQLHGGTTAPAPAAPSPQSASDYYSQPVSYAQRFQPLADLGREAAQGASLGLYQAPPDVAQRTGMAGTVAQGVGGILPFAGGEGLLGLAGMGAGLARTIGAGALTGGANAAGTELGTGQPLSAPDIAMGAGVGGTAGALAHGLASGVGRLASTTPGVPAASELKGLTDSAYKKAEDLGATYPAADFGQAVKDIAAKVNAANYDAPLPTFVNRGISQLSNVADKGEPVGLMTIENLRKTIAKDIASPSADPSEARLGKLVTGGVDDFLKTNPDAYDAIAAARKQAQIGFKDTDLATALTNAKMRTAASTGTIGGPGYEGRIRGSLEGLREGDTAWTPDESAQLNSAITGTPFQNVLRQVGRYAGGIVPLGVEAGAGLATGFPGIAAGVGAAGLASRFASTQMAKNAAEALRQTVRAGGVTPAMITPNTDALAQALAVAQLQAAQRAQQ